MCVRHTGFSFSVLLLCLQFFFCELSDRNLLYKGFPIILNSHINSHLVLKIFYHFSFLKILFLWQLPLPPYIMEKVSFMCLVFAGRGLPFWISFHVSLESQLLFGLNKNCNFVDYWSFFYCFVFQYSFMAFSIQSGT